MLHCNIDYAIIRELAMLTLLRKIYTKIVEAKMKEAETMVAYYKQHYTMPSHRG